MTTEQPGVSAMSAELGLPVAAYEASPSVQLVACRQRDGSRLWAIRDSHCSVLNKEGFWEYEPLPSGRDDEFLARCRYATPLEARDAYLRSLKHPTPALCGPQGPHQSGPQG